MSPGVLVYANIGAKSLAFGTQEFYIAVALLLLLVVVSMVLKHSVKKRLDRYEEHSKEA
jgi:uncharacterized membrane protein YfcA